MLLKKLFAAVRTPKPQAAVTEYPLETEARLAALHDRAPIRRHLDTLYGDLAIGTERYTELYDRCLKETGTVVTPFNVLQRFQTRYDMVKYLLATRDVPGGRVECGAYRGATGLLLCRAWRSVHPGFDGAGFYLIDSYSGTAAPAPEDRIPTRDESGATRLECFFQPGKSDVRVDDVRAAFGEFPAARIVEGWIPDVFAALPEQRWAFVHIDVTLYRPTLAALEHFYAGLNPGGVLLCDGSIFCPGVDAAIERFSERTGAPYALLGHRQYVVLKA